MITVVSSTGFSGSRALAQSFDLLEYFGKWTTVYRQFRRWTLAVVWEAMLEALAGGRIEPDSVQMIDGAIVRAHHLAAGAKRGTQKQGFGRSKGGFTTKIQIRTHAIGLTLADEITVGEVSDYKGYDVVMEADAPDPKVMLADRGSDSDRIRTDLAQRCAGPMIAGRKSRKKPIAIDDFIYTLRNRIERAINEFKRSSGLATRYDKTADIYFGFDRLTRVRLWVRHFVNRA